MRSAAPHRGRVRDHRDDDAVAALFDRADEEQGRLDLLVNNAFIVTNELHVRSTVLGAAASNWDDMIDVGTRPPTSRACSPRQRMVRARRVSSSTSAVQERRSTRHVAYGVARRSTASPPTPRFELRHTTSRSCRSGRDSCGRNGSTSQSTTVWFPTLSTSNRPSRPGSPDAPWSLCDRPRRVVGRAKRSRCTTSPSSAASRRRRPPSPGPMHHSTPDS